MEYADLTDFESVLRDLLARQAKPIDAIRITRRVLDDLLRTTTQGADAIIAAVAAAHNLSVDALRGHSQEHVVVWPRHHAAWELRRRRPEMPLVKIAAWLNRADHSTIVNGMKRFQTAVDVGRYAEERDLVGRALC